VFNDKRMAWYIITEFTESKINENKRKNYYLYLKSDAYLEFYFRGDDENIKYNIRL